MISQNSTSKLAELYSNACGLDMRAIKPGNVGMHSKSNGLCVDDFMKSAEVSVAPLLEASLTLGERIYAAVKATHEAVSTNTNLGIILLAAPLVQAWIGKKAEQSLQKSLHLVLGSTTVNDAVQVYQAIRMAEPGGMGIKQDQDLSDEPTVNLRETMKIAASWDRIADQYSNNYADIFSFGIPRFRELVDRWNDERWATTGLFLGYLARFPDSLIERKFGRLKAREISDMIIPLEKDLYRSDFPGRYEEKLMMLDHHLKCDRINPGTSADLTVASIIAAGISQLPGHS